MKYGVQPIAITALMYDGWMTSQMREWSDLNESIGRQYGLLIKDGRAFDPPVSFLDPVTERHHVGDGFQRIVGHHHIGRAFLDVDVRRGSLHDAIMFNIQSNREHKGLPFMKGDYKRCITTLLQQAETKDWTPKQIQEYVGCDINTVYKTRQTFENMKNNSPLSPEKLAAVAQRRLRVIAGKANGDSVNEMADREGVKTQVIYQDLRTMKAVGTETVPVGSVRCEHCDGTGFRRR